MVLTTHPHLAPLGLRGLVLGDLYLKDGGFYAYVYIIQYIHTQYIYNTTLYSYVYKRMYVHARAVEGAATTVFMIWQLAGLRAWLMVRLKGVEDVCFVYRQV